MTEDSKNKKTKKSRLQTNVLRKSPQANNWDRAGEFLMDGEKMSNKKHKKLDPRVEKQIRITIKSRKKNAKGRNNPWSQQQEGLNTLLEIYLLKIKNQNILDFLFFIHNS